MFLLIHDSFGSVESAMLGKQRPVIQERPFCSDLHVGGSMGMDTARRSASNEPYHSGGNSSGTDAKAKGAVFLSTITES